MSEIEFWVCQAGGGLWRTTLLATGESMGVQRPWTVSWVSGALGWGQAAQLPLLTAY